MEVLKNFALIVIGLASGGIIAGAVFAFITMVGIIPRFAQKSSTEKYVKVYENAIILGGIFGSTTLFAHYYIPLGNVIVVFLSLLIGVFYGSLAVCLAEVLNAIPILVMRLDIKKGIMYFLLSMSLGKFIGSLLYFFVPGFYELR